MSLVPIDDGAETEHDEDASDIRISSLTVAVLATVMIGAFSAVGFLAYDKNRPSPLVIATNDSDIGDGPSIATTQSAQREDATDDSPQNRDNPDDPKEYAMDGMENSLQDADERSLQIESTASTSPTVFDDAPSIKPPKGDAGGPTASAADASEGTAFSGEDEGGATLATDDTGAEEHSVAEPAANEDATNAPAADAPGIDDEPADDADGSEFAPETPAKDAPAPIDALSGSHVVQVGSFRTVDEAVADWKRIEGGFAALLSDKARQIERADLGDRGVFHRLRIGPFSSADDARTHCQALKEGGQDCLVVRH